MKISEPLILYTRAGCHLCELAATLLDRAGISWRPVDIDGDANLTEDYGLRVPVLRRPDSGHELDYPFDEARVADFIRGSTA
jgi:hypothetical protein